MDYHNQHSNGKQRRTDTILPWVLSALAVIVLGAGLFIYQQRQTEGRWPAFTATLGEMKAWVAERKSRLKSEVAAAKTLAAAPDEAASQVHFEFYTSLPNMQVSATAPVVASSTSTTKRPVMVSRADDLEKDVLATLQSKDKN